MNIEKIRMTNKAASRSGEIVMKNIKLSDSKEDNSHEPRQS